MKYPRWFGPGASADSSVRRNAIRVTNRVLRRLPPSRPVVTYEVDDFPMLIPLSHPLPRILAVDRLYQAPLRILAETMSTTTEHPIAVDIGANIGDTAITMAFGGCSTVVCVEGNPAFLPVLRSNAQRAGARGWRFDVVDRFVSIGSAQSGSLETKFGTARLVERESATAQSHAFVSAADLLERYDRVDLLKIDTDGMDLQILHECLTADRDQRIHSVFFEYTPAAEDLESIADLLTQQGFSTLFWFDHRGTFVRSTDPGDVVHVRALSEAARANRGYYDIAALRCPPALIDRFESACRNLTAAGRIDATG